MSSTLQWRRLGPRTACTRAGEGWRGGPLKGRGVEGEEWWAGEGRGVED